MEINAELIKKTSDEDLNDYLLELDKRSDEEYQSDKIAYQNSCGMKKEIGPELHRRGGENLMRTILLIATSEGGHIDFIGREWNGIGAWQGQVVNTIWISEIFQAKTSQVSADL